MKIISLSLSIILVGFLLLSNVISAEKRGLQWQGPSKAISTPYLQGNYRAVIIGNSTYQDKEGIWRSLKTPSNDADVLASVLHQDYGFADVTVLKDAGRRDILLALNDLSSRVEPNDSVLVYYAGHGHLNEETNRGYWIPVDAEGEDSTTFIRNSTIRDEINIIAEKTKHTLLVSDSCFSGSLLRSGNRAAKKTEKTNPYFIKVSNKKSVQILAAGGIEYVDDNYKNSGHSPFTYFLINELKNNIDNLLTMSELAQNVIRAVANNVEQMPQAGVLQGAGDELGEFIFARVSLKDETIEIFAGSIPAATEKDQSPEKTDDTEHESAILRVPLPRF